MIFFYKISTKDDFMNKKFYFINVFFLLAIIVADVLFMTYDNIFIKATASILFVTLALINLLYARKNKYENKNFQILIFIGLFFAMLGDIVLEIQFIIGAVLFAIGHLFYFLSYSSLLKINWKDFVIGLVIFTSSVLFITIAPIFDFKSIIMQIVCIVYALIISLMVGKSISNFIVLRTKLNLVLCIGSILFFFSDLMLLLNVFSFIVFPFGILCLSTYYPAQFLLAFSILKSNN